MARYGLLGEHLAHSYSPRIHTLLGGYEYELVERSPDAVAALLADLPYDGLNVTIPYKKTVMPFCAALSPAAQAIGSVNTLVKRPDGTLYGDNTDYDGLRWLLHSAGFEVAGKPCLVLGSGGASLAAQAVLRDLGASQVVVISRSGADNYDNLDRHADAAYLVNTTPVGMFPAVDAAPLSLAHFPQLEGVVDLIYNPARTMLMIDAQDRGIPVIGGLPMLVAQARRAAELFTGTAIPDARVEEVTAQLSAETRSIALIGMPGCGKSTTGTALAAALGRSFVDLDAEIVRRAGKSIPEIFADEGQDAFRALESEVVRDVCPRSGVVIATGGGVVTRAVNRIPLLQNSVVIFLRREIEGLPTDGRPLSQSTPLSTLAAERLPLYNAWCDLAVDAVGVEATVAKIRDLLGI